MKNRKILATILFAVLCCPAIALSACNQRTTPTEHTHSWSEWAVTTQPTETETGKATRTCSGTGDCDAETTDKEYTLPALTSTDYTKTEDTATCTADGEIIYTLSINNETISFTVGTSATGHSFDESFWLGDGITHWHRATCGHDVKGDEASCVDEDGDLSCDVCGYAVHQHTYEWGGDDDEHWYQPTCGDTTEITGKAAHIDEDNDDMCDVCGRLLPHTHKYSEEWSFDENKHWHAPICTDTADGKDEAAHSFENGVCECGVKQVEVEVYAIYAERESGDIYSFVNWLASLKEAGVEQVSIAESGDVTYRYENGTTEIEYFAERTVKVKAATSDGEGIANVWVMVSMFEDGEYKEIGDTYALGIAETDEDGIAEIAFMPVGGYTSTSVSYRIRLAEAKDIALNQGIDEEDAKPLPNRYTSESESYIAVEVNGNAVSDDSVGQLTFTFSKGWNAYDKFTLPYARYYEDLINGTNIKEEEYTYAFTTSGDNLFDYFYFGPAKYSFASATTDEEAAQIESNAKLAASGVYKISFTIEGNANVTLYYWNEKGVNLGAYHVTNSDGTPSDDYITSISGGTAGSGKYTGGNYVEVTIAPEYGLRLYQFGIISDAAVSITFTVERTGDYEEKGSSGSLGVGEENSVSATFEESGASTAIILNNVPEGMYTVTVIPDTSMTINSNTAGTLYAYTDDGTNKTCLYDPSISKFKGIISIPANAESLYIQNMIGDAISGTLILEEYTIPTLEASTQIYVPATNAMALSNATDISYNLPLGDTMKSGTYYINVTLYGTVVLGGTTNNTRIYKVTVTVGDRDYTISTSTATYSTVITIPEGVTYITIKNNTPNCNIFTARVYINTVADVQAGVETTVKIRWDDVAQESYKYFKFTATKTGTYTITVTSNMEWNYENSSSLKSYDVVNVSTGEYIIKHIVSLNYAPETISGTFELNEGDEIVLKLSPGCYGLDSDSQEYINDSIFVIEYEDSEGSEGSESSESSEDAENVD